VIYLLDTNAISVLMRADARTGSWLSSVRVDDRVVICTIARGEILFGLGRLAQGRRRAELEAKAQNLFAALPCEPIPPGACDFCARLKITRSATAPAINATLVSRDSDFQGIEGLAVVVP
jgi:predicted nucleic acid-binding protein